MVVGVQAAPRSLRRCGSDPRSETRSRGLQDYNTCTMLLDTWVVEYAAGLQGLFTFVYSAHIAHQGDGRSLNLLFEETASKSISFSVVYYGRTDVESVSDLNVEHGGGGSTVSEGIQRRGSLSKGGNAQAQE